MADRLIDMESGPIELAKPSKELRIFVPRDTDILAMANRSAEVLAMLTRWRTGEFSRMDDAVRAMVEVLVENLEEARTQNAQLLAAISPPQIRVEQIEVKAPVHFWSNGGIVCAERGDVGTLREMNSELDYVTCLSCLRITAVQKRPASVYSARDIVHLTAPGGVACGEPFVNRKDSVEIGMVTCVECLRQGSLNNGFTRGRAPIHYPSQQDRPVCGSESNMDVSTDWDNVTCMPCLRREASEADFVTITQEIHFFMAGAGAACRAEGGISGSRLSEVTCLACLRMAAYSKDPRIADKLGVMPIYSDMLTRLIDVGMNAVRANSSEDEEMWKLLSTTRDQAEMLAREIGIPYVIPESRLPF